MPVPDEYHHCRRAGNVACPKIQSNGQEDCYRWRCKIYGQQNELIVQNDKMEHWVCCRNMTMYRKDDIVVDYPKKLRKWEFVWVKQKPNNRNNKRVVWDSINTMGYRQLLKFEWIKNASCRFKRVVSPSSSTASSTPSSPRASNNILPKKRKLDDESIGDQHQPQRQQQHQH